MYSRNYLIGAAYKVLRVPPDSVPRFPCALPLLLASITRGASFYIFASGPQKNPQCPCNRAISEYYSLHLLSLFLTSHSLLKTYLIYFLHLLSLFRVYRSAFCIITYLYYHHCEKQPAVVWHKQS